MKSSADWLSQQDRWLDGCWGTQNIHSLPGVHVNNRTVAFVQIWRKIQERVLCERWRYVVYIVVVQFRSPLRHIIMPQGKKQRTCKPSRLLSHVWSTTILSCLFLRKSCFLNCSVISNWFWCVFPQLTEAIASAASCVRENPPITKQRTVANLCSGHLCVWVVQLRESPRGLWETHRQLAKDLSVQTIELYVVVKQNRKSSLVLAFVHQTAVTLAYSSTSQDKMCLDQKHIRCQTWIELGTSWRKLFIENPELPLHPTNLDLPTLHLAAYLAAFLETISWYKKSRQGLALSVWPPFQWVSELLLPLEYFFFMKLLSSSFRFKLKKPKSVH